MSCPQVIKVVTPGPPGIGLPAGTAGDVGKFLQLRRTGGNPYDTEWVPADQVGLPQGLSTSSSPTFAGLTVSGLPADRLVFTGPGGTLIPISLGANLSIVNGALVAAGGGGGGAGTVTSVGLTMPTGFAVASSPITASGTLAVTFAAGYSLPTTASQASWDTAATLAATAVQPAGLAAGLALKADLSDARFTDSREWSAATVTQAEAEAGVSTTRRAFTPQRVFQAAAGWWVGYASAVGQAVATAASQAAGRTALGLGSAATAASTDFATAAQGAKADTAIQPGNAALTDAREWTADTISQAEAEAGSATTRRAFTAQRVVQAVAAWWAASAAKTKLDGIAAGAEVNVNADWDATSGDAQILNKPTIFTSSTAGLVPASGGGTTNFLRADGTFAAPVASGGGATNIWIPAAQWIPATTNGCGVNSLETSTNKVNYDVLEFDSATSEQADCIIVLPNNWSYGTVTARFYWTAASGSGGVVWQLAGLAYGDNVALDTALGTAQSVADTLQTAGNMHVTSATAAITIAGTPAANKPVQFQIKRLPADASDTLGVDARLIGVEVTF